MRNAAKHIMWNVLYAVRNALDLVFNFQETAILGYHSISDSGHETAVAPKALGEHLAALAARGFVFVSLQDITTWMQGSRTLPRKAAALTFDDGYADFESSALPLLKKYNAPAAVFVIGAPDAADYRVDEQPFLAAQSIERLHAEPLVEVGYHSKTHPNLATLSPQELVVEVAPPFGARYFAYPGGNHSPQAVQALRQAGYEAAFTIRPVLVQKGMDPYLLPRTVVLKNMSPREIAMRASRAATWYKFLADLL